jgi:hypothetical protein
MVNAHSVFSCIQWYSWSTKNYTVQLQLQLQVALSGLSLQHQELRFKAQMEFDGSIGNILPNRQKAVLFPEAHYAQG